MMDTVQNRSRGFGFVTFENGSGGAQKAIESQPINMFGKMVEVKLATPKGGSAANPFAPQPHHRNKVMTCLHLLLVNLQDWLHRMVEQVGKQVMVPKPLVELDGM